MRSGWSWTKRRRTKGRLKTIKSGGGVAAERNCAVAGDTDGTGVQLVFTV